MSQRSSTAKNPRALGRKGIYRAALSMVQPPKRERPRGFFFVFVFFFFYCFFFSGKTAAREAKSVG